MPKCSASDTCTKRDKETVWGMAEFILGYVIFHKDEEKLDHHPKYEDFFFSFSSFFFLNEVYVNW